MNCWPAWLRNFWDVPTHPTTPYSLFKFLAGGLELTPSCYQDLLKVLSLDRVGLFNVKALTSVLCLTYLISHFLNYWYNTGTIYFRDILLYTSPTSKVSGKQDIITWYEHCIYLEIKSYLETKWKKWKSIQTFVCICTKDNGCTWFLLPYSCILYNIMLLIINYRMSLL